MAAINLGIIGFGIMGGWNQAQAHAQFVANVVDFNMNVQMALEAARFTKGTFDGCDVQMETRVAEAVRQGARELVQAHAGLEQRVVLRHVGERPGLEVGRPARLLLHAERVQVRPGVDAGRVSIVEVQGNRVVADRFDRVDVDVALARDEHLLPWPVALHLGRR